MSWITSSISNRLFTVSLGGLVVILIIAAGTISSLTNSLEHHQQLIKEMEQAVKVEALSAHVKSQIQEWTFVLLSDADSGDREKYWNRFLKLQDNIQDDTKHLLDKLTVAEAKANIVKFQRTHKQLAEEYTRNYNAYIEGRLEADTGREAEASIDQEPGKLLEETAMLIDDLVIEASQEAAAKANQVSNIALPVVTLVTVIVLVAMYLLVNRLIVAPLKSLQQHAKEYGEGNFTASIDMSRNDEIGDLAHDLQAMKENISDILREVASTADALIQTAQQLDRAADELTSNTSNTERNLDTTSAGMTEMATVARDVANCANDANETANAVEQAATGGLATMNKTISAINILAEQVESVTETMAKLEHDSANVGSVLDVIKGIAEQTNLLALNAAIEAARAGEQGRGFAVVADEVRTLAQRTQESTEEINQIIIALQQAATGAARLMDDNRERTLASVDLAGETGQSIEIIVAEVEKIRSLSSQIFTATEEQRSAASSIDESITTVATMASETHHLAKNARSIAQDLSGAAGNMSTAVGRIQI